MTYDMEIYAVVMLCETRAGGFGPRGAAGATCIVDYLTKRLSLEPRVGTLTIVAANS